MSPVISDVVIRPARPDDADRIADIAEAAWEPLLEPYRDRLDPDLFERRLGNWRASKRAQVTGHLAQYPDQTLVAELGGEVVGFATYMLNHDSGVGEIGNNAVDPRFQGQGIGVRMYDVVMERFRAAGMVWAHVFTWLDEGHARARRAYEKAGFEQAFWHVDYFRKV